MVKKAESSPLYPSVLVGWAVALKEAKQLTWEKVAVELGIANAESFVRIAALYRAGKSSHVVADKLYEDFPKIMTGLRAGSRVEDIALSVDRDQAGVYKVLKRFGIGKIERAAIQRGELEPPPISVIWTGRWERTKSTAS